MTPKSCAGKRTHRLMMVDVVICARNEEAALPLVLESLQTQTVPPRSIVVIDGGSTDRTFEVAREHGAIVIAFPTHTGNHAGTPEMAKKFNPGFAILPPNDYIMVMGADDPLTSRNYIEELSRRMDADPKLVVASGQADNDPCLPTAPRGTGRLIKTSFWRDVMGGKYPDAWCWEEYILYKAKSLGFTTLAFPDLKFHRIRTRRSLKKGVGDGRANYELGHAWFYMLIHCGLYLLKSPRVALGMFWGWLTAPLVGAKRLDVAVWVRENDWRRIRNLLMEQ